MNRVVISGRLTADPKIIETDKALIAKYFLACDRSYGEKKDADFIPCTAFGATAEFVEKYLKKGMKMLVEGNLRTGSYEKDGITFYTMDVIAERHEFMESKKEDSKPDRKIRKR